MHLKCHFQLIYYKLTHGRHETPFQIKIANLFTETHVVKVL